jgi:hypothetical protein
MGGTSVGQGGDKRYSGTRKVFSKIVKKRRKSIVNNASSSTYIFHEGVKKE